MPRNQIQITEIVTAAAESLRHSMYHCLPGIVQAYHADEQTADVLPAVRDPRFDPDTGERLTFNLQGEVDEDFSNDEPWPAIPRVPIAFPRFGGFTVAGPLNVGDKVLLIAFDLDPTVHRITGAVENPADVRRHGGNYWWAVPADITDPGRMRDAGAASSVMVIGKDGASQQIRIDDNHINLGASPSDAVALASKIDSLINVLVATYTPAGPETGFASLIAALQTWKMANWSGGTPTTGSALVKAGA